MPLLAFPFPPEPECCRLGMEVRMLPVLAITAALLVQTPSSPTPAQTAVRLWRTDSTLYVTMRQPGHLLLMHVDAIGRIDVLFPLVPDDGTGMPGDTTLAFDLSPVAEGNPATFVAVRSRWPFDFSVLRCLQRERLDHESAAGASTGRRSGNAHDGVLLHAALPGRSGPDGAG